MKKAKCPKCRKLMKEIESEDDVFGYICFGCRLLVNVSKAETETVKFYKNELKPITRKIRNV